MKYVLWTIVAMLVVIAGSYLERGYWAAGIEIFFPLGAILVYQCKKRAS